MKKISKILLISLALTNMNVFAEDIKNENSSNFYIKGFGGGSYSHDIDVKLDNTEQNLVSDFSGFAGIGLGLQYGGSASWSIEVNYIKPFENNFIAKDLKKIKDILTNQMEQVWK